METLCKGSRRQGNIDQMQKRNTFLLRGKEILSTWEKNPFDISLPVDIWVEMGHLSCAILHSNPESKTHSRSIDARFPNPLMNPFHIPPSQWKGLIDLVSSVLQKHERAAKVNQVWFIIWILATFLFLRTTISMKHLSAGGGVWTAGEDPQRGSRGESLQRPPGLHPRHEGTLPVQCSCFCEGFKKICHTSLLLSNATIPVETDIKKIGTLPKGWQLKSSTKSFVTYWGGGVFMVFSRKVPQDFSW